MLRGLSFYFVLYLLAVPQGVPVQAAPKPAPPSQAALPTSQSDILTLSNADISASWSIRGGSLRWQSLTNHFTSTTLSLHGSVFELVPKEGPVLRSSDFKIVGSVLREIPGVPDQSTIDASKPAQSHPRPPARIEIRANRKRSTKASSSKAHSCRTPTIETSFIQGRRSLAGPRIARRTRGSLREDPCHVGCDPARRHQLHSPGSHHPLAPPEPGALADHPHRRGHAQ